MGGNQSDSQGESFRREDWGVVERSETSSTWQNLRDPTQRIEQYILYSSSQQQYKHERQIYYMRKNHPQVVAALYLSSQSNSDFCSTSYQQKLFIEKIPIRLADIEHIPFPDYLHIYSQALKGYSYLSTHIGYFPVEEDYIGINQKSVVKVWMNPELSKSQVIGHRVSQEVMVRTIIQIVDKNIDRSLTLIPSVKDYIYNNTDKVTFEEALASLSNFIQQYNGGITPHKLQCIDKVGGIYAIANRDRTIHPQTIKEQHHQVIVQGNDFNQTKSRPRLVDSQILNQFQYPTQQGPHYPNQQVQYYQIPNYVPSVQSSQIVPSSQNNILTPSTVRQNVPIIRREPYLMNNNVRFQENIPQPQIFPLPNNNIIFRPQQRLQNVPQQQNIVFSKQTPFPQPPQPVLQVERGNQIVNNSSQIKIQQNSPLLQNNNFNVRQNTNQIYNQPPIVGNFYNFPPNQKNPTAQPNKEPEIINFRKADNPQQINFPQFRPPVLQNSQVNYVSRPNNQPSPNVSLPKVNQPPPNTFNFDFKQKEPSESSQNININDGKSSSDFFSRLNALNSTEGLTGLKYLPQSNETLNKTINLTAYQYKNPFDQSRQNTKASQQKPNQSYHKVQQYQNSNGIQQNFGKSAVSDIIQGNYESNYASDKIKQPLKFENNLDMKYSIFQTEQAQFQPSYAFKKYQTNFDPELLQDINKLKQ